MFIEKSKQALSTIDAHTGERDYLKVDKDSTGFTIKVPNGKTKLKITKWYGVGQELTREFNVIGSGSEKGVSGMAQINTSNAFAEDYCEAYSGYGIYSFDKDECTTTFSGYKNGEKVYDTKCYEVFFNYTDNNVQMRLVKDGAVHAERFYKEIEHPFKNESGYAIANMLPIENLRVRCFRIFTTEALMFFMSFFETPFFMGELNESDNLFFKDGLDVCIGKNDSGFLYKDWNSYFEEEPTAKKYENAFFINQSISVDGYGEYSLFLYYCTDSIPENGIAKGNYLSAFHRVSMVFESDDVALKNKEYLLANFLPDVITEEVTRFHPKAYPAYPQSIQRYDFNFGIFTISCKNYMFTVQHPTDANYNSISNATSIDDFDTRIIGVFDLYKEPTSYWSNKESAVLSFLNKLMLTPLKFRFQYYTNPSNAYHLGLDSSAKITVGHFKYLKELSVAWGARFDIVTLDGYTTKNNECFFFDYRDMKLLKFFTSIGYRFTSFYYSGNELNYDKKYLTIAEPISEYTPPLGYWGSNIDGFVENIRTKGGTAYFNIEEKEFTSFYGGTSAISFFEYSLRFGDAEKICLSNSFCFYKNDNKLLIQGETDDIFLDYVINKIGASNIHVYTDNNHSYPFENIIVNNNISQNVFDGGMPIVTSLACKKNNVKFSFQDNHIHFGFAGNESFPSRVTNPILSVVSTSLSLVTGMYNGFSWWLKWKDSLSVLVKEYAGDGEPIAKLIIEYLQNLCLPKINHIIVKLKSVFTVFNGLGTSEFYLTDGQIRTVMERAINEFFITGNMETSFYINYSYSFYDQADNGYEIRFGNADLLVHVISSMHTSFEVSPAGLYATVLSSYPKNLAESVPSVEEEFGRVVISVADASKVRTIAYTSPIEIASISINGERIDVANRMIDADMPRKFSIGNSTVTWKDSIITIYNFSAVTSLKIGDASFII